MNGILHMIMAYLWYPQHHVSGLDRRVSTSRDLDELSIIERVIVDGPGNSFVLFRFKGQHSVFKLRDGAKIIF